MVRLNVRIFFDPLAFCDRKKCRSVNKCCVKNKSATIGRSRCVYSKMMWRACSPFYTVRYGEIYIKNKSKLATQTYWTVKKEFTSTKQKKRMRTPSLYNYKVCFFYFGFIHCHYYGWEQLYFVRFCNTKQWINWNWFTVCRVDVSISRWFVPSNIIGWITECVLCMLNMSESNLKKLYNLIK